MSINANERNKKKLRQIESITGAEKLMKSLMREKLFVRRKYFTRLAFKILMSTRLSHFSDCENFFA